MNYQFSNRDLSQKISIENLFNHKHLLQPKSQN